MSKQYLCKRYGGTINPQHVQDFADLCARKRIPGLFIHVGRTGRMSREISRSDRYVKIVSGPEVVSLINGKPINA